MSARLVLLGPPGAGKGTQAVRLAAELGVPHVSTGDIFRMNMSQGTDLGRAAQEYVTAGKLVPDEITDAMVRDRLAAPDAAAGFLLDGYPRNVDQVERLDETLAGLGTGLDGVVELRADTEAVIARLLKRAEIEGRPDDTEPVIRRRLEIYAEQTAPVAAVYDRRALLVPVDGMGTVEEVAQRVLTAVRDTVG